MSPYFAAFMTEFRYLCGAILPNAKIFGGVKRFLELGNEFAERGVGFIIFTPTGASPDWFDFQGEVKSFDQLGDFNFEVIFITESQFIPQLFRCKSKRKIFYYVTAKLVLHRVLRFREIEIFANSTTTYNQARRFYFTTPFKAFGGINTEKFVPKLAYDRNKSDPLVVMAYGRLNRRKKGTHLVVRACERLYRRRLNIKLLLFDTPLDEKSRLLIENFTCKLPFEFVTNHPVSKNNALFHRADIFVSAEKGGGWSNTVAEAMAAGIPVVATKNGTTDFLFDNITGLVAKRSVRSLEKSIAKLYHDDDMRQRLAVGARHRIEKFTWKNLAQRIDNYLSG